VEIGKPPVPPQEAFEAYVAKLRRLAVSSRPRPSGSLVPTLEATDSAMSSALLELTIVPTPSGHRRVAERYRELGVLDLAYDHFSRAVQLDRSDAAAYDGLARIWRDWGTPALGLPDALRAVRYAPSWAPAHNTLGTLLLALGRQPEARRAYERALALDPKAAYALNNLCYLSFLQGEFTKAASECQAALTIDPGLTAARNNLALLDAAGGRDDLARREFLAAGSAAAAFYNMGIVQLAGRQYASATQAFEAARDERPTWAAARERASQARRLSAATLLPAD